MRFRDGIGVRIATADAFGEPIEQLQVCADLAALESAVRERVSRLINFRHVRYVRLRGSERLTNATKDVVVTYDAVPGTRLSEFLELALHAPLRIDIDTALQIVRELLPAIAVLHDSRNVTHGAIAPERLVLTPQGRLVIVDHGLGLALGKLGYSRKRFWQQLRVPVPQGTGKILFDARTDVVQIGMVALALVLGRPIDESDFPQNLEKLLDGAKETPAAGQSRALSSELRAWLDRALPLEKRVAFATVREAQQEFEKLFSGKRYAPNSNALKNLAAKYAAVAQGKAPVEDAPAAPAAAPEPIGAPIEHEIARPLGSDRRREAQPPPLVRPDGHVPEHTEVPVTSLADAVGLGPKGRVRQTVRKALVTPIPDLLSRDSSSSSSKLSINAKSADVKAPDAKIAGVKDDAKSTTAKGTDAKGAQKPAVNVPLPSDVAAFEEVASDTYTDAQVSIATKGTQAEPPAPSAKITTSDVDAQSILLMDSVDDETPLVPASAFEEAAPDIDRFAGMGRNGGKAPEVTAKAPEAKVPGIRIADVNPSSIKAPAAKAPATIKTPDLKTPEVKTADLKAAEPKLAEPKPPVFKVEVKAPDLKAPAAKAPEIKAPEVKAPVTTPPAVIAPAAKAPAPTAPSVNVPAANVPATIAARAPAANVPPATVTPAVPPAVIPAASSPAPPMATVTPAAPAPPSVAIPVAKIPLPGTPVAAPAAPPAAVAPPKVSVPLPSVLPPVVTPVAPAASIATPLESSPAALPLLTTPAPPVTPVVAPRVATTPVTATPVTATPIAFTPVAPTPVAPPAVALTPVAPPPVATTPVTAAPVTATPVAKTPVATTPAVATPSISNLPEPELFVEPAPVPVVVEEPTRKKSLASKLWAAVPKPKKSSPPPSIVSMPSDMMDSASAPATLAASEAAPQVTAAPAAAAVSTPVVQTAPAMPAVAPATLAASSTPAASADPAAHAPAAKSTSIDWHNDLAVSEAVPAWARGREATDAAPGNEGAVDFDEASGSLSSAVAASSSSPVSAFMAAPKPVVIKLEPATSSSSASSPASSTPSSSSSADASLSSSSSEEPQRMLLRPGSGFFGADAAAEGESEEGEKVVAFKRPRRQMPRIHINWRRTLAATLVVSIMEGVAFATAYWYVVPTETGSLLVETTPPGIEILVDGRAAGHTPFSDSMMPGRHTIELRQGANSRVLPVEISSGVQTMQRVTWSKGLKTGQARVTATAQNAHVTIDGMKWGKAPLTISTLAAGKHMVQIESDAGTVNTPIAVSPGETTELDVPIYPGWVSVLASVQLFIYEGERFLGTTEGEKLMLAPGKHTLDFVSEELGFKRTLEVTITPGATAAVSLPMPKVPVTIEGPAGADLMVDGEPMGKLPMTGLQVSLGTRDFVIKHPDHGEKRQVVTATNLAPVRVNLR